VCKSLNNFLKDSFPDLYHKYLYSNYTSQPETKRIVTFKSPNRIYRPIIFEELPTISELHKNHAAKLYLQHRKVPEAFLRNAYYTENWKKFAKHTYNNIDKEESRIVIPLIINDQAVGFQARLLGVSVGIRYITIMLADAPKIYGHDLIDWNKPVYVVEGVYDSLFVPNCIAMLGSSIDLDFLNSKSNTKFVFLYDNEPYNTQIVNQMKKVVDLGHSVCIWDKSYKEKDINDCLINGTDINPVINNDYSGTRAKLEISNFIK
jgi:hypothetical protein